MQENLDAYLETYNYRSPPPQPRDGGQDALRGLQGRGPHQVTGPEEAGQKGGQDRSADPDLGEAGCQVITVLAHGSFKLR